MYSNRGWSYSPQPSPHKSSAVRRRPRISRRPRMPRFPKPPQLRLPRLPRLPNVGPLPFAIALVAVAAWYHFGFEGFSIDGSIVDAATGAPIAAARVWSTQSNALAREDGSFTLPKVKPPEMLAADAPGYRGWTDRLSTPFDRLALRLEPIGVDITTVDADTGRPVAASIGSPSPARTLGSGEFHVAPVRPAQQFTFSSEGYLPASVTFNGENALRVPLQPRLNGRIVDAHSGRGVPGAHVSIGGQTLATDEDGNYEIKRRPTEGQLQVLAPGFRSAHADLAQHPGLDVRLQPIEVRAMYMTYFAIGGEEYRQDMYRLLDTSEINAVVIDVKGDYGLLSYRSNVPLARTIGADAQPTIDDPDQLLRSLHEHGAYVIGRIVVFKDSMLARNGSRAGLDVGVKDRTTGQLWSDLEDQVWVDPFQTAAWDYNTALAREAIEHGFDEVQFDYIRFPTDPAAKSSIGDIVYSQPMSEEARVAALRSFLGQAHRAVNEAGGYLAMDTFGYTTWWDDDGGIGQDLEVLADDIDYYCPMVYPSTFNAGLPGAIPYPDVVNRPYDVVYESLKHAQQKLAGKRVVVRPWLQYFDDYPWATKIRYDAPQIDAQKKAVVDSRSLGWMLWNAGSLFKRGGIAPK
jgi:hypothetical protein